MINITSKENGFFKKIKKLKSKKYREEFKEFLVEGIKVTDYFKNYDSILIKKSKSHNYLEFLFKENVYIFDDSLFDEVSAQENSQGIIFVFKYLNRKIDTETNDLIILDHIQDPGNLGTILRIIDAVGLKNVIFTKGTCDIYNEKVVRSSMGSIFNINFEYMELNKLLFFLKEKKFNILVTALEKDSINYDEMVLHEKNAIIFGNEGNGVSKELIDNSNLKLIIPIYGDAESLNVAVASGVFLYKYIEKLKIN